MTEYHIRVSARCVFWTNFMTNLYSCQYPQLLCSNQEPPPTWHWPRRFVVFTCNGYNARTKAKPPSLALMKSLQWPHGQSISRSDDAGMNIQSELRVFRDNIHVNAASRTAPNFFLAEPILSSFIPFPENDAMDTAIAHGKLSFLVTKLYPQIISRVASCTLLDQ